MRRLVQVSAHRLGYDITRRDDLHPVADDFTALPALQRALADIPGMVSPQRGAAHYLLTFVQSVTGDVVEVGAWQGRNTCFLAAACRDSGNGIVHAIDHFRGNPGKMTSYRVDATDLSDLRGRFRTHVRAAGLDRWVKLHDCDVSNVQLDVPVRLLFVDGEHTYDATRRDLERFEQLLQPGGLVVFDDYSTRFPGVVEAASEWVTRAGAAAVQVGNGLVVRVP